MGQVQNKPRTEIHIIQWKTTSQFTQLTSLPEIELDAHKTPNLPQKTTRMAWKSRWGVVSRSNAMSKKADVH